MQRELMFGAAADPGEVFAALSARYCVQTDPATSLRWICLDTADWRLHRAGMTLLDARRGHTAELILSAGECDAITAPARARSWPRRLETLSPSPVRDRIAHAVGVRALLPFAEVDVRSIQFRLLDDDDKTRVRLQVDQQRLRGANQAALPLRVLVSPLRGYERDAERCVGLLDDAMNMAGEGMAAATVAMTAAGFLPGQPSVRPPRLDPAAPAVESLVGVLRRWMDLIDIARPGVLTDVDIEYLHELRTAVRATRSMLSLAGGLLPRTEVERSAAEFAWLGRLTAPVRDLDVHLLELADGATADLSGLADLEPLRRHLLTRRRSALNALRVGLTSERGASLSGDWRRSLDLVAATQHPAPTTHDSAATQARAAYRRIVKAAAPVTPDTPADDLHRLRRRCKRMRYLLDGYESVYRPGPHREVLSALKKLQDCLGEIQDSDVQSRQLKEIAAVLTRRDVSVDTVLAMGALRERAMRRDAAARHDLAGRLQRFCAPSTLDAVRALDTRAS